MKDTVISRETPMIKNKRRFCKVEGCNRIVKSQGLCQRHGAKPQKCRVVDCTKQAQGGFGGMCKAHFRASQVQVLACQIISEEAQQVESVSDRVIPASLSWTPRGSGGPMPLVAHLKEGMDGKKPPGWHRNEERRARHQAPVAQLMTEFDDWEIELLYSESLILTGTSQLSFKYLAYGWGREVGFHIELVKSVFASRRVLMPSAAAAAAFGAAAEFAGGSNESGVSSHHEGSSNGGASPHPYPHNKEEDTIGSSSATSGGDDDSNHWRNGQNQGYSVDQAGQTASREKNDLQGNLALMSSRLNAGDDWMDYSGVQPEGAGSGEHHEYQNRGERATSISEMSDWGLTSDDWTNYHVAESSEDSKEMSGRHASSSSNNTNNAGRTTYAGPSTNASPARGDWANKNSVAAATAAQLEPISERTPSAFPKRGHHRGVPHDKAPGTSSSGDKFITGSIGQVDDLGDIDYSTYCLSMQFDEVTLQNIYNEPGPDAS